MLRDADYWVYWLYLEGPSTLAGAPYKFPTTHYVRATRLAYRLLRPPPFVNVFAEGGLHKHNAEIASHYRAARREAGR